MGGAKGGTNPAYKGWDNQITGSAQTLTSLIARYGSTSLALQHYYGSKSASKNKAYASNVLSIEAALKKGGLGKSADSIPVFTGVGNALGQVGNAAGSVVGNAAGSVVGGIAGIPGAIAALPGDLIGGIVGAIESPFKGSHLWKTLLVITAILVLIGVAVSLAKSESQQVVPVPV